MAEESVSHAKVRFIENGEKQTVHVRSIVEFKKHPPKHKGDFKTDKVYTCVYQDKNYPIPTEYAVQIGKLYDDEDDECNKRVSFLPLEQSLIDRYYDKQADETITEDIANAETNILQQKKKQKEIKKKSLIKDKEQQQNILKKKMETVMSGATLQLSKEAIKHDSTVATSPSTNKKDSVSNSGDNHESSIALKLERDKMKEKYESEKFEKIQFEEKYDSIKRNYEDLLKKYNEKQETLESLQIFNKKLQKMTLEKNSDNNDLKKSCDNSKSLIHPSPPVSPIPVDINFKYGCMYSSSPIEPHDSSSSTDSTNTSIKKSIRHATHAVENKRKSYIVNDSAEGSMINKEMDYEMMVNNKNKNNGNGTCYNAQTSCSDQETATSTKSKRTLTTPDEDIRQDKAETKKSRALKKSKNSFKLKEDSVSGRQFQDKFNQDNVKIHQSPRLSPIPVDTNVKYGCPHTSSPIESHDYSNSDSTNTSIRSHANHTVKNKRKSNNIVNDSAEGSKVNKEVDHEITVNNKNTNNGNGTGDNTQPSCSHHETPKSTKRKRILTILNEDIRQDEDETEKSSGLKKSKNSLKLKDDSVSGRQFLDKFKQDNVKMVYLRHDFSMPYDNWKFACKSKTQSMFSKRLLRHFYSPSKLRRRCIKEGSNVRTPNGVNKRRAISPKKTSTIAKALEYYLQKYENVTSAEIINKKVEKLTHYFSEEINATKKKNK